MLKDVKINLLFKGENMLKLYVLFFTLFICNFITSMDFEKIDEFKTLAYKSLTPEQQSNLAPQSYISDREKGRMAIEALAYQAVQYAYEGQDIDLQNIMNAYANYLIDLREAVLSSHEIQVIDVKSAQARAAQLLDKEQMESLQKEKYLANREKALITIAIFAEYTFNLLLKHSLISDRINFEEFKQYFIKAKTEELDALYN